MAGLWDYINGPIAEVTLPHYDFCTAIFAVRVGDRTPVQVRNLLNALLAQQDPTVQLDAHAEQDLVDINNYIAAGTGETGQMVRWLRVCSVLSAWERNVMQLTEAESRAQTGVTFTF